MEETVQLQPRGIGELLDQAVRLYRRNFFTFIGIIAIVQIPITILSFLFSWLTASSTLSDASYEQQLMQMGGGLGGSLITGIANFVLNGIATAALTRAIADNYLGERTGFLEAYHKVGKDWPRVLGALLLCGLIEILLVIWFVIPCIGWFSGLGMMIAFGIVIQFVPIVVVLEHKSSSDAVRRGWDLYRRRFWNVIGFYVLLLLFAQIIVTAPTFLITMLIQWSTASLPSMLTSTLAQSGVTLVTTLLYTPLQLTAMMLMYFDLRVRNEGFDLAWLTERSLNEEISSEDITAQAPPAEQGNLITQSELGKFVLLSLGLIGIFAVIYGAIIAIMYV